MWFVGLVGILAGSEERFNQLWWVKPASCYVVLVLLLRFGLQALEGASPADWASVIGGGRMRRL